MRLLPILLPSNEKGELGEQHLLSGYNVPSAVPNILHKLSVYEAYNIYLKKNDYLPRGIKELVQV